MQIGLIGILILAVIGLPMAAMADVLQVVRRWRAVPLPQKNMLRATWAAFVLVALAVLAARGIIPAGGRNIAAGIVAFAVLYLVVGIQGAHGAVRYDFMSAFWWAVLAVGCVSLLVAHTVGAFSLATLSRWGSSLWSRLLGELSL